MAAGDCPRLHQSAVGQGEGVGHTSAYPPRTPKHGCSMNLIGQLLHGLQALGFEVRELRCILTEDMRRFERRHLKERAFVDEQVATVHFSTGKELAFPTSTKAAGS